MKPEKIAVKLAPTHLPPNPPNLGMVKSEGLGAKKRKLGKPNLSNF